MTDAGYESPVTDHLGYKNRYFLYVTPLMTDAAPGPIKTILTSPMLSGQEHPVECLKFWFNLKVREVFKMFGVRANSRLGPPNLVQNNNFALRNNPKVVSLLFFTEKIF